MDSKLRPPRRYKAGQLVLVSSEAYSDYSIHGFFRVLKDFEIREVVGLWIAETNPKIERYGVSISDLMAFIHAKGYLEDVDYSEIWLGGYGTLGVDVAPPNWTGAVE